MFHKYTLTELLVERKLDEGFLDNYADDIKNSKEWNDSNDLYSPALHRIRKEKLRIQKRLKEEQEAAQKAKEVYEKNKTTEREIRQAESDFKKAYKNLSALGISSSTFEKAYGKKEMTVDELYKNIRALPRVINKIKKAEAGVKILSGVLAAGAAGLAVAVGGVGIGGAAAVVVLLSKGSWFLDHVGPLMDSLDFANELGKIDLSDRSNDITMMEYFGFDNEAIELIGSQGGNDSIFGNPESEKNRRTGVEQWNIQARLPAIIRSAKKEGKISKWTPARFQTFCIKHLFGPEEAEQFAPERPNQAFVDWIAVEKDLESQISLTRTGYDKWLGGLDDLVVQSFRNFFAFFSFGTYKNKFDTLQNDLDILKELEGLEDEIRDVKAGNTPSTKSDVQKRIERAISYVEEIESEEANGSFLSKLNLDANTLL